MLGLLTFLDRSDTKATVVKAATSPLAPPSFFLVHIFNRNHARSMAAFVLPWRAPLRCCRPGKRGGGVDAARGSGGAGIGSGKRGRGRGARGRGGGGRSQGGGRNKKKFEKRRNRRIGASKMRKERACLVAQVAELKAVATAAATLATALRVRVSGAGGG
jgi:hypothetical protein